MLSKDEISKFVYDPNSVQTYIMGKIEESVDGDIDIVDPTNPFTMLLEMAAVSCSAPIVEMKNTLRKMYPNLANTKQELYHHLTDDVISNMFAIPAEANLVFYISMLDLKQNGYRIDGNNYVEMTLPMFTEITVADTVFTLLNDILIRLYDNGNVFIEQQNNDNDIAVNDIGIINSVITSATDGNSWILFETRVKQVKRILLNDTIIPSEGYSTSIYIEDQYFYSTVSYKNALTNNQYVTIQKSHSDEYIDPYTPTVYIRENDTTIDYSIPDVYLVDGGISGNVEIVTYTTKGKLFLPINNYILDDYQLTLGNTGASVTTAVSPNITILVSSRYVVEGGVDNISTDDLKKRIVYNTTGDIDLPITEYDIKQKAEFYGFELFKALDIITDRLYIASKSTTNLTSDLVKARADIFNNTTKVLIGDMVNNDSVYIDTTYAIIKSNTIFRDINGVVEIITDQEKEYILNLNDAAKIDYFKDKKYYYTPYYYVIEKEYNIVNSRIYDLDSPTMENLKILDKNNNTNLRVNIDKYSIEKTASGYEITILPVLNEEFKNVDLSKLHLQLSIPLIDSSEYIYYDSTYDIATGYFKVLLTTDNKIDKYNNITLTNGYSRISNRNININSPVTIHTYLNDPLVSDDTMFLQNELYNITNSIVITKERIDTIFGVELKYLWNRIRNEYSERMYLKYTIDKPLLYKEDIYEIDPTTGTIFDTDENGDIRYNILHHEGDTVLDNDGNIVYEYKKGDIVLDDKGLPVIDTNNGIIRYIDILMFEIEFKLTHSDVYTNYNQMLLDLLKIWLLEQLTELNNLTLENTAILYKSYKSTLPVKININNVTYSSPYSISPKVTLYTVNADYSVDDIAIMKKQIGDIIHDSLDTTTISLDVIKKDIIAKIGNDIVGVKISGLDNLGDLEVFTITDKATRLTINKVLEKDTDNNLIVDYDLTLTIQKV